MTPSGDMEKEYEWDKETMREQYSKTETNKKGRISLKIKLGLEEIRSESKLDLGETRSCWEVRERVGSVTRTGSATGSEDFLREWERKCEMRFRA